MSESHTTEKGNKTSKLNSDVSYVLIHEASSLSDYENLQNPNSIEAQVSRSRGKTNINDTVSTGSSTTYELTVSQGKLSIDTGYVVRFVNKEYHSLTVFDIIGLNEIQAYPAPEKMIESLPMKIVARLKEQGYVKVSGVYDSSQSIFRQPHLGWDDSVGTDVWDKLMDVIEEVGSTPPAVDYTYFKYGPGRWDLESIAESRNVQYDTVEENVEMVAKRLEQ